MLERLKEINGKTKKSKQGVVLVTILFILAIALIFIASALMLTTATRTRLYTRAEDNQARLTVTSAAESFYQALYMQEITDAQLLGLGGSSIRLVNEAVPGMSASDDTNCTFAYFTKNADKTMVIDFKTRIGDQVECIKMVLDYNEPTEPAHNFAHMLNVSKGGSINHVAIGMATGTMGSGTSGWGDMGTWGKPSANDNTLVFRGFRENAYSDTGNNYYYSDVISTGTYTPIDSFFFGDLVFWGKDSSYELNKVSGSPVTLSNGNVYFVGNTKSITNAGNAVGAGNYPNCGEWFKGKGNVVFYDESAQTITFEKDQNHANNSADLKFYKTSNTTLGGSAPSTVGTVVVGDDQYKGATKHLGINYTKTEVGKKGGDLLSYQGIAQEYGWAKNITAAQSYPTVPSGILSKSGESKLASGTYKIYGTMGAGKTNPVIECDLSAGDYIFYITSKFTIESGYFKIINGAGSSNNVIFIICTGQQFVISERGTDGLAGIVCTNCYKSELTDPSKAYDFYRSYANIDPKAVPHAFIYSMGTGGTDGLSQLYMDSNRNAVLNAFVGLYPNSSGGKDDGTLYVLAAETCMFYGRLTCQSVKVNGTGQIRIPYCPQPGSDRLSDKPQEKYTDFKIFDYQYYTEAV
ncbi:MAG: hypothetical protein MJ108_01725 [Saccharofermentans sp.]|nr:hypothetical protein [Saccharofermentans sp.]